MKLIKSIIGSITTGLLYIVVAHLLDHIIEPQIANVISLLCSFLFNFFIQSFVYNTKPINMTHVYKEIFVIIIYISINQYLLNYFITHKDEYSKHLPEELDKYYNTIIRQMLVVSMYFCVSNPLRKYWVFI